MALPKLNTSSHELTLPSSKRTIKYRAMTVGEEKILAIAKSSDDSKEIITAIKQVISNCSFDTVDPERISLVDFEFLFLHIRIRSKGEVSELKMACMNENAGESGTSKCGEMIDVDLDLTKYKIKNIGKEGKVLLTDGIGLMMKSPSLSIMSILVNDKISDYNQNLEVIQECIDYVFDGDEIYHFKDYSKSEIDDFMSTIESSNMEDIKDFVDNLPTIYYEVEYKCPKCGHISKRTIEGISNFF